MIKIFRLLNATLGLLAILISIANIIAKQNIIESIIFILIIFPGMFISWIYYIKNNHF